MTLLTYWAIAWAIGLWLSALLMLPTWAWKRMRWRFAPRLMRTVRWQQNRLGTTYQNLGQGKGITT